MSVPKHMQSKYDEIAALIAPFCDEYLNDEYKALCLHALEKLCRKRPSPLLSGRAQTWAGAILYAVGQANFLFDKSRTPYMKASELAERIGVGNSTLSAKAKELQKTLKINFYSAEWALPSLMDDNPLIWMVQVNGFVMDARSLPLEAQILCYEKGLIPYVPVLKDAKDRNDEA